MNAENFFDCDGIFQMDPLICHDNLQMTLCILSNIIFCFMIKSKGKNADNANVEKDKIKILPEKIKDCARRYKERKIEKKFCSSFLLITDNYM